MEKEKRRRKGRSRKRGNKRRNKVLARSGFTSDSMILRGLGGSIGKGPSSWGPSRHATPRRVHPVGATASIAPQESKRNALAFYGVRPLFYGDRFPPATFPRRIIDPDPIVFERESCASALSTERHTNLRINPISVSICRVGKN